jgi:D-3-phosphoglycerate dehydrogenase
MTRVLANDGMHDAGIAKLRQAGFEVVTDKVEQDDLSTALKDYDALLVRSATKVRQPLIDAVPNLKFIGRGGVGMDNIDVDYARSKGIAVHNTPAASSESVAELCIAHAFGLSRNLHRTNRVMPGMDGAGFKALKKACSKGHELSGKTIGIIGFGRIGQALASLALGCGMRVLPHRRTPGSVEVPVHIHGMDPIPVSLDVVSKEVLLAESDIVSLNLPFKAGNSPILGEAELQQMKPGALLLNAARGGAVDEEALLKALDSGHIGGAALDVFDGEPEIKEALSRHERVSISPHIGGSTLEAQARIGLEMADHLIAHFQKA